ncbi:DUF742 domain-containing protein [Streptomyces samsunensis]|uniref:Uncharacterized protein n=3 Tax=Streptomyces TaxID=1883 RepID=A0A291SPB3_STRMQ|nr:MULTISPECIES: DUF742 domain-containing protein [Streptomyces]MYU15114.1 DUF742 domain-containing protein [Streptomyces sp. SID8361]AQA11724.1 RNA polymerase subunit sigma-24 [Streptomyces autolyticus]ATL82695.1 hypothetical protein SMALA_2461 [Streptomyces malaysiensis]AUA14000.1 hypothetical protein CFP59_06174 [Streptomyces sp. M56]MCC4317826.1 DUF742 domain-containing protein [Streptomyces malaysiensis]
MSFPGEERTTAAVRPYVITRGRAGSSREALPLETLVMASGNALPPHLQPEYRRIADFCQGLLSVAEVAAHLGQAPAVVQVLLADLIDWGHIVARPPIRVVKRKRADLDLLRKVLDGLESKL